MADHAIYISVLEMEIEENHLKGVIKVFTDDLADALRSYDEDLNHEIKLEKYFGDKLSIKPHPNIGPISIESHYEEGDSYRIHFSRTISPSVLKIDISAPYFMELFPDQQNILKLTIGGEKKFHIFKTQEDIFTVKISN